MRTEYLKKCKNLLTQLKPVTAICKNCFKDIKYSTFTRILLKKCTFCNKCYSNFKPVFHHFKVEKYHATNIYEYDEVIQKYIYQLKGLCDIEIAPIFLERYVWYFKIIYHNYLIVPCPSYVFHDEERGFNHVEEIFKVLDIKMLKILYKNKDYKQSDQHGFERYKIKDVLEIKNAEQIRDKNILLVDDVFTTGSTIKASLKLLEKFSPKKIKILIISKVNHLQT